MPEFGIQYTKVTQSKHAEILAHLKHTFFIDEPLTSAVKLCTPGSGHPELEQVSNLSSLWPSFLTFDSCQD